MSLTWEERYERDKRRAYENWMRSAVAGGGSLADVCSTNAGEGGGSRANVCGIDSASSLADVCNTNDVGRGRDGQGQRGRGEIGRPASATPRFAGSTPDSDEEAFETPASVKSSAHSKAEAVTDLQQRSNGEDGWWEREASVKSSAHSKAEAVTDLQQRSDGEDGWWEREAGTASRVSCSRLTAI
jgi:hypothetical protein